MVRDVFDDYKGVLGGLFAFFILIGCLIWYQYTRIEDAEDRLKQSIIETTITSEEAQTIIANELGVAENKVVVTKEDGLYRAETDDAIYRMDLDKKSQSVISSVLVLKKDTGE